MGFSKKNYSPVIEIEVRHPYYRGEVFTFTFPKVLPQSALDAEKTYLGLPDTEQPEALRKGLIGVVAEMVARAPFGFDDFPGAAQEMRIDELRALLAAPHKEGDRPGEWQEELTALEQQLASINETPLSQRVRDYFDDPAKPELEQIISGAWRAYKTAAIPAAYLKSGSGDGARDSDAASVS